MASVGNVGAHVLENVTVAVCPPIRFTSRSFHLSVRDIALRTPITHVVVDPLIVQEMSGPVVNKDVDPLSVFPYVALPARYVKQSETPEKALVRMLSDLKGLGLYHNNRWLLNPRLATTEAQTASLFQEIIQSLHSEGGDTPSLVWRDYSRMTTTDNRRPDVVLVPSLFQTTKNLTADVILSYCEVKSTFNQSLTTTACQQLTEFAGLALSSQFGRRFYVAMSLCGNHLSLAVFVRGCYLFTAPLEINENPLDFLHILLTLSSGWESSRWTGFNERLAGQSIGPYSLKIHPPTPVNSPATGKELPLNIIRPLFRARGMEGKGTVASLCQFTTAVYDRRSAVLKECWVNEDWPDDIDIHRILIAREALSITQEEKDIFGEADQYNIFSGCVKSRDEWNNTHLPGIPIVCEWEVVHQNLPVVENRTHALYEDLEDTTANIVKRFWRLDGRYLSYEPRKHIRTLSRTCGIPISFFSCRREFLNGFMGALVGHYNGLRKDVLHCDISEGNLWLKVATLEAEDAVPNWDHECSGIFTRRAGVLGDWGSAQDLRGEVKPSGQKEGFVTGTFPFIATELLSNHGQDDEKTSRTVDHDLESFFWVLWSLSINIAGPYGDVRKWKDCRDANLTRPPARQASHRAGTSSEPLSPSSQPPAASSPDQGLFRTTNKPAAEAYAGTTRYADDKYSFPIPAWATYGTYGCTFKDVYNWRVSADEDSICNPISPYFREGSNGEAFMKGMKKLFRYFIWTGSSQPREGRITHKIFVDILREMRDAIIPEEDGPSPSNVKQARDLYRQDASTLSGVVLPSSTTIFRSSVRTRRMGSGASSRRKHTLEHAEAGTSKRVRPFQESRVSHSQSSGATSDYVLLGTGGQAELSKRG